MPLLEEDRLKAPMEEGQSKLIDVSELRKGMFIQLDLGWMDHPFPLNSFRISTDEQIRTIVSLGVANVRHFPERSDTPAPPVPDAAEAAPESSCDATGVAGDRTDGVSTDGAARRARARRLEREQHRLAVCERQFSDASRQFRRVVETLHASPLLARQDSESVASRCVDELIGQGESVIRLLSESVGERSGQHSVNVMVVSLMLGRSLGLQREALVELGLAALLHDIGKLELPDRFRNAEDGFSAVEHRLYQSHVSHSISMAQSMGLPPGVVAGIAQHHEMVDGSGFPARITADRMQMPGKIVSLVNRYDNLCNPARGSVVTTPHEALSLIFAQMQTNFDPVVLGAFIRMMGVYPPGSIVQLGNDRYGLVVSVNAQRPLRPKVILHDPAVPRNEALILDLETQPELGIRRSLKPHQLPKAAIDYLSPRRRICYFFERAADPDAIGVAA
ncbi:HD-GYP domain-containing protein [Xylophilus ampelinus]|uniref:Putative nucleotidyltransferase with HDIG domain n=1 Tax=Xylophilus ampelinus TaxID=54067 RepID=A0A318SIG5_9BURK|nr:HD-GYP domain-containing protein [Xylophilus ampelinus]MCS4509917.1 DUF3391 domain-containing protein [Xylophilus ampelinus]PYE78533.1 putative nucleotidyltransferase with HDIG domain [Xylophilus ampelinus]